MTDYAPELQPVPATLAELHRHLVLDHGVPAGFIETTSYTESEWQWEHRGYHDAHAGQVQQPAGPATRTYGPGCRSPRHDREHVHRGQLPAGELAALQLAAGGGR